MFFFLLEKTNRFCCCVTASNISALLLDLLKLLFEKPDLVQVLPMCIIFLTVLCIMFVRTKLKSDY